MLICGFEPAVENRMSLEFNVWKRRAVRPQITKFRKDQTGNRGESSRSLRIVELSNE